MHRIVVCFIFLAGTFSGVTQSVLSKWEGIYNGQMIIGSTERPNDTLSVKFELMPIIPDSSWTYRMTYLSKRYGEIVKDYEILREGSSTTNFLLDEKDGIIIEMSLMNECFYDLFEVMGQLYSVTMRKLGVDIQFDLFVADKKGMVTQSIPDENDEVYEVSSYKPTLHQTVLLKPALNH